jgi:hypothetical protein
MTGTEGCAEAMMKIATMIAGNKAWGLIIFMLRV